MKLSDPVSTIPLVGPSYKTRLDKLNIITVGDLMLHVPTRYRDFSKLAKIANLQIGDTVTIKGEVTSAINQYTKSGKQMQIVRIVDETGSMDALWFNQKYLLSSLRIGTKLFLSGELSWFGRKKVMVSPEFEYASSKGVHTGRLVPVYSETKGVSSKWLRSRIAAVFPNLRSDFQEFLPKNILEKNELESYSDAINSIHFPANVDESQKGRHRLAFNELLSLQLAAQLRKLDWQKNSEAHKLEVSKNKYKQFTDSLPYTLTASQKRSIYEIFSDLAKDYPMNRLLEGDVGSGKTVVAAAACYVAFANGYKSVVMAPTQILATQHYQTLEEILKPMKMKISLVTSASKKGDPNKSDVIVGTHSLIHKRDDLEKIAVVVIDEQHRFGVTQRASLIKPSTRGRKIPDVLTMTATPIPRTIALAAYGDLDLSTLDELPAGRKKITTWIVPPMKRAGAYGWIKKQIKENGTQAFVVCPLIEESESELLLQVKAVKVQFNEIKNLFPKMKVDILHGRLNAKEKDIALQSFKSGKTNILVSTPVIEVGIDVPNAAIILIEAADRFGLAQLHQLRGRVGRGTRKSYCLLFTENRSDKVFERLRALKSANSGFELAELDLKLRGPGEIFGTRQSGFSELKIASWTDSELIRKTKAVATEAANNPQKYKLLYEYLKGKQEIPN